jgi:hypothetical protein
MSLLSKVHALIMKHRVAAVLLVVALVVIAVLISRRRESFTIAQNLQEDLAVAAPVQVPINPQDGTGSNDVDPTQGASDLAPSTVAAADLLPVDQADDEFAKKHPTVDGILANKNFLESGSIIGQISEPLRNTNLSIRAEPVIPKAVISPWMNSTAPTSTGLGLGDVV